MKERRCCIFERTVGYRSGSRRSELRISSNEIEISTCQRFCFWKMEEHTKQEYILGFERFKFRNKAWRSNRNRWSKRGAGKSTLLRLIAGIYVPENGAVKTYGKISLLAGLGAGFQSNLTGRENIMLSSSIYGFTKEQILEMTPSIIDYSGIESFIDQPIRTYSSGMRARLAFSIVSHIEPDIILIDEVIAVGDASFKKKSMARIKELASSDSTVIIVSHSQSLLKMICDKIICLDNGKLDCFTEDKDHAISRYHELSKKNKK